MKEPANGGALDALAQSHLLTADNCNLTHLAIFRLDRDFLLLTAERARCDWRHSNRIRIGHQLVGGIIRHIRWHIIGSGVVIRWHIVGSGVTVLRPNEKRIVAKNSSVMMA